MVLTEKASFILILSNICATLALIRMTVADTSPIPGGIYMLKIDDRKTM